MTAAEVFRRILGALESAGIADAAGEARRRGGFLRARSAELDASYMERWVQQFGIERECAATRRATKGS